MKNGFVKLQRDIQGTWIHDSDRYFRAWCTILLSVNWKPSKVRIGSKMLNCDENEALFSLDTWAKKFGKDWTKEQVRRFFKRLTTQHYISTMGDTKTTRLKVLEPISCEELEHDKGTTPDTITTHDPTPIEELRRKKEELRIKEEKEREAKTLAQLNSLKSDLQKANAQILELKNQEKEKEKNVAPKKRKKGFVIEDCDFPPEFELNPKLKTAFLKFAAMRKEKGKPYKTKSGTETKINTLAKDVGRFGLENVIGAIVHSTGMEYQGIFVKDYTDKINKQKKDEQKQSANNGKSIYENYAESIGLDLNKGNGNTTDADWSEA